ncbi:diacylglycerol kinase family protein [Paenibacillus sp. CF384]|uniref:diacylglycerol/lipid kinase family protein n=1 Tax=Paenibacillus sp. CF384 TaxID=1884382 RepID=UPI000895148C|nr:diacylglycerol kinase family protein [Paenibacillus sp. CF384]SDW67725.1 lipid kinase, YegS/Rv2252/BmrU family [Paenibacillus sp. CF384]
MWVFAVNDKSGGGRGKKVWALVEAELQRRKLPYQAILARTPEEACTEIRKQLANYKGSSTDLAADVPATANSNGSLGSPAVQPAVQAVIVIGGDGTIHSILPALYESGVPLGIIPSGSGNDTARAFEIPSEPIEALNRILSCESALPVDLIVLHSSAPGEPSTMRPVLTALAVGFDAAIAAAVNRSAYKKLCNLLGAGSFAYVIGLFQMLMSYRPRPIIVTVDGKAHEFERGWMAAVCSVPAYGGGLRICPDASPTDGLLDVCVIHTCTALQMLRVFPTLLSGKHVHLPYVKMLRGKVVTVADQQRTGEEPIGIYGDGEPAGATPLYAEAAGNRISLLR